MDNTLLFPWFRSRHGLRSFFKKGVKNQRFFCIHQGTSRPKIGSTNAVIYYGFSLVVLPHRVHQWWGGLCRLGGWPSLARLLYVRRRGAAPFRIIGSELAGPPCFIVPHHGSFSRLARLRCPCFCPESHGTELWSFHILSLSRNSFSWASSHLGSPRASAPHPRAQPDLGLSGTGSSWLWALASPVVPLLSVQG